MTNPYQKLRGTNKLNLQANQVQMPSPVREGVTLNFRMVIVKRDEIESKTFKCPYNHRSADHLTVGSVLDILPEIQEAKRNAFPALGSQAGGGKIEVLAGMRRRKAVSLVEDGEFYILVSDDLTEEEKAAFAKTSDDYEKPSKLDVGLSMAEYRRIEIEKGNKVSHEKLAELFKISTGQVSENLRFTDLPSELFQLFPSLSMISYRFLRQMLKFHKEGEAALRAVVKRAVEDGMRVTVSDEMSLEDLQSECKALESSLIAMLNKAPKKAADSDVWKGVKPVENVSYSVTKSGVINLKLDSKKIDKKLLDKIKRAISQ